jgi:hypothetical protein
MATYTLKIMGRDVQVEVPDPEHTVTEEFRQQVQEGWGNDAALEDARLAAEVRAMDATAYARFRRQHGIGGPDLIDFLGGSAR